MEQKVNQCYDFFTKIKLEREKNARLMIRYWCKKYFLTKKAKKLAEIERKKKLAAKKAEDAKKRIGKYGYSPAKKKGTTKKPVQKPKVDLSATQSSAFTTQMEQTTITQPQMDGADEQQDQQDEEDEAQHEGRLEDKEDVATEMGDDFNQREDRGDMEDDEGNGEQQEHV